MNQQTFYAAIRSSLIAIWAIALLLFANPHQGLASGQPSPQLTVYRSPTCGCCENWVAHMRTAGFQINDNITPNMEAIRRTHGVPEALASCHTALIEGYVIEGHVPTADVQKLLAKSPNVIGLTAPGMPAGSPGMEMDNRSDPYTVFTFTSKSATPFANHN